MMRLADLDRADFSGIGGDGRNFESGSFEAGDEIRVDAVVAVVFGFDRFDAVDRIEERVRKESDGVEVVENRRISGLTGLGAVERRDDTVL